MIINKCPNCGKENELGKVFQITGTYLWANSSGGVRKHFCKFCNHSSKTRFFKDEREDIVYDIKPMK